MNNAPESSTSSSMDEIAKGLFSAEAIGSLQKRYRRALMFGYGAHSAYRTGRRLYLRMRDQASYVITVQGTDAIYDDLHRWLLSLMPEERRRSMVARTQDNGRAVLMSRGSDDAMPVSEGSFESSPRKKKEVQRSWVTLGYSGDREQTVDINGFRIKVFVERSGYMSTNRDGDRSSEDFWHDRKHERIIFTAPNIESREAVVRFLETIASDRFNPKEERNPEFHLSSSWGDFRRRNDIPRRSIDTVILRAGQMERIVGVVEEFFANEERYAALGQPWHLGILLDGPPGTGKTSIAKALATHFGMDIYAIPLADLRQDAGLMDLVSSVRAGSMLLLEDLDVFAAAQVRGEDEKGDGVFKGATMSGLLNSIDGVSTPHGLITVMTTNRPEVLDEAVIRAGRADHREHVGFLDTEQAQRLVAMFYGESYADGVKPITDEMEITSATVTGIFKEHLRDATGAVDALNQIALVGLDG